MNMNAAGLALERVGVFQDLDTAALHEIAAVMEPINLPGGVMLFDQGDSGDTLYIVAHGRLQVSVPGARGGRRVVAELGRGESVGEMALLTGERRSARVAAIRDSVLLALSRAAFAQVVERHPRVLLQLARQLVDRLKESLRGAPSRHSLSTVCVVPAIPGIPVSGFCAQLAQALSALSPTVHLTAATARAALSVPAEVPTLDVGRDDTRLIAWLNEQEELNVYVVYEPDPRDSGWSQLCERQADRILLLARSTDVPPEVPVVLDKHAGAGTTRRELVLMNASGPVAGGTLRWLRAFPAIAGWHHVTEGSSVDIQRVARLIAGQGVGLMLGGGGARSFAHIGVLRAMREAGIMVDVIGGVSGGAIVGAQLAAGATPEEIKDRARAEFIGRGSLLDFTVPVVSLIRGDRFKNMLTRMYGERNIEDLPQRFFCHSANLSQGSMRIHDRGTVWKAVGASMSIPGIGPPVCENGDLLIDGSVLTNLPVDIMRDVCQGRVVAIDVSADRDLSVDRSWEEFPSPGRLLIARPWRRRGLRIPTILEILFRGAMLSSIVGERNVRELVEFYMRPPLSGVGLLDFKSLDRVEQAAYRYAVEALKQWPFSRPAA
jgi:predicted acylesterase/phospholipase RssA/CRP-like cAMP-binding protein